MTTALTIAGYQAERGFGKFTAEVFPSDAVLDSYLVTGYFERHPSELELEVISVQYVTEDGCEDVKLPPDIRQAIEAAIVEQTWEADTREIMEAKGLR